MKLKDLKEDFVLAAEHIILAGKILNSIGMEETNEEELILYSLASNLLELSEQVSDGADEQNKIDNLYKEEINDISSLLGDD